MKKKVLVIKRLKFKYQLSAFYNRPITDHRFVFRFLPCDNVRQKIENTDIFISNCHRYDIITDSFENRMISGHINMQHARFDLTMSGSAITGIDIYEEYTDCPQNYNFYRLQTNMTRMGKSLADLRQSVRLSRFGSDYEKALYLTQILADILQYAPELTKVGDTAEQALVKGGGVCQDFAHIMLSLLRAEGVTARYAAGMLLGEGGSHAWTEVLCCGYWYGFDPTNRKLVNDEYIRISCGRDAGDCSVISGTMNGGAVQQQSELVKVTIAK